MGNKLQQEKSPYLLQHGENPVDWYPWGEEAFQKAVEEDKPIFLSIGYSTCHWCHVMAHESFEDEQVAELLNRDFVSIKVDREERPDVDSVYMSVCQTLTGSGGWPLTVIMTPEQKPFFVATYLPKNGNYMQYGLMELLEKITYLWKNERDNLLHTGDQITQEINRTRTIESKNPTRNLIHQAYKELSRRYDDKRGGFSMPPKFPTPHNLLFLMRYGKMEQDTHALKMVEVTLEAMARGGIQDHIGGGFSRYSTDGIWLVPHFEKMLYDNALLILAYAMAYQLTDKEVWAEVVRRTADYVLRELTGVEGGFFCGQDADSDGVEGKYYCFTPNEIKTVLGEKDGVEFCKKYGITEVGNFEGKNIPNRIGQTEKGFEMNDVRLKKLYDYRLSRTKLHTDDKMLLSWNAWMIIALARAGQALGEERYLQAAVTAHKFMKNNMVDEENYLYLRYREGEAAHAGQLDDYAVYALALLTLYRVTFQEDYLLEAIYRGKQMVELFEDKENGGYFMTAANAEQLIARPKETYDGAIPSGNSVAALVLQNLSLLTAESEWQKAADRQFHFLAGDMEEYPAGHCFGLFALMNALYPHRELVCVSRIGLPDELKDYLKNNPADDLQILLKTAENEEILSKYIPFIANYPVPEQGVVYYLCEGGTCKAPVTEFKQAIYSNHNAKCVDGFWRK